MTSNDQQTIEAAIAHESSPFRDAIKAIVAAEPDALHSLLAVHPELAYERSSSPHQATLLHYVTANGIEDTLQTSPNSIYQRMQNCHEDERRLATQHVVEIIRILISAGSDVDATASADEDGAFQTPLNWLVSSDHPAKAGVLPTLVAELCGHGAKVDGLADNSSPMIAALAFGHPEAVRPLVEHGARTDNLLLAAAAGNLDQVRSYRTSDGFDAGDVQRCSLSWFHIPESRSDTAQLAFVIACMCGHTAVVRFFIESGLDINAIPPGSHVMGGPLHTASLMCQREVVELLIAHGADPTKRDARYNGAAIDWALLGHDPSIIRSIQKYLPEYQRKSRGSHSDIRTFVGAVRSGEPNQVADALNRLALSPEDLDGPWFDFDSPAVVQAKENLRIIDLLTDAGANINKKSEWWAGGFGVLDGTDPSLAEELIRRGARLDVWSAAELGKLKQLEAMIAAQPECVHAQGPDGKTPLHCAGNINVAKSLLLAGAHIDARDIDHESTPAQYLVSSRPDVVRFLVEQGCRTDIMLATALGDATLVEHILAEYPSSIRTTIDRHWFPTSAAEHIYSWTLGWYLTPHQVAFKFGHAHVVQLLLENSTADVALVNACLLEFKDVVHRILRDHPETVSQLSDDQKCQIAHAARNNQHGAIQLMLLAGFPTDAVGQHGATPLHWAAFHGNHAMIDVLLRHHSPREARDADFGATPLQWARHGCVNGWNLSDCDYPRTVTALLRAGCHVEHDWPPTGHAAVDHVFASAAKRE